MSTPKVRWTEDGTTRHARWRGENGAAPRRVVIADDRTKADTAYRLACRGIGLLWRGDFRNARQLLSAMGRRADRGRQRRTGTNATGTELAGAERSGSDFSGAAATAEAFRAHRRRQARRARTLGMLLVPLDDDYSVALRSAPDVRQACTEAYGPATEPSVTSLRELLGLIGAHEWRKTGVEVPALGQRIYPHYGVFSPVRGEYPRLVARAPLPTARLAFDIGTGTGVLAAVLAQRGVARVVATDHDPRALACARENLTWLGFADRVRVVAADVFPVGSAPLVVCNPPWIPAQPVTALDRAIYDPGGAMLHGFLRGLPEHLDPGGEGWLVLSDLAEHLGLRSRAELLAAFVAAGLRVLGREDIEPEHPRSRDATDPLHAARSAETTSLWRLGVRD